MPNQNAATFQSECSPHCLNIGGTESQCGKVGNHNYDYPPNAVGEGTLSPAIQECYEEGAVIDIESVLTAHHKGHFELKACPVAPGEVPTQACFDSNKLTFVEDKLYGALPDPLYPERGEIYSTSSVLHMRYATTKNSDSYQIILYSLHSSCFGDTEGGEWKLQIPPSVQVA